MSATDELLATLELRTVADRYAMAVDRGDGERFADQFTPDGVLEAPRGVFRGRDQLAGVPAMMKRLYLRTQHGVLAMVPAFDGDRAAVETSGLARHYYQGPDDTEYCYEMAIRYEDAFRRTDEGWRLEGRKLVLVGDATYPTGRAHPIRSPAGPGTNGGRS